MAETSFHGKYRVNEYIAFLRKNGLAVNNLYAVKITPPNDILLDLMNRNSILSVENDDTGNDITTSGILGVEGLVNLKKYSSKGINLAKNSLGIVGAGNKGNIRSKINLATTMTGVNSTDKNVIEMLCTSAQLPFYKSQAGESFYNHYKHKSITGFNTDAIPLSFYIDRKDQLVLNFFTEWNKLIYESGNKGKESQLGWINYKKNYKTNIEVILLNKSSTGLKQFFSATLVDAFPSAIDAINVTSGATELIQLKVNIEFDKIIHTVTPLNDPEPDINMTGAELKKLGVLDMKNFATQAVITARDIADNIVSDARSAIANIHETKNLVKNSIDSVKNLPKSIKTETNDIVGNAKKSIKF